MLCSVDERIDNAVRIEDNCQDCDECVFICCVCREEFDQDQGYSVRENTNVERTNNTEQVLCDGDVQSFGRAPSHHGFLDMPLDETEDENVGNEDDDERSYEEQRNDPAEEIQIILHEVDSADGYR